MIKRIYVWHEPNEESIAVEMQGRTKSTARSHKSSLLKEFERDYTRSNQNPFIEL